MMVMNLIHHHKQQHRQRQQQQQQRHGMLNLVVLFILLIFSECLLVQRNVLLVGAVGGFGGHAEHAAADTITTQTQMQQQQQQQQSMVQSELQKSQTVDDEQSMQQQQPQHQQVPATLANNRDNNNKNNNNRAPTSTIVSTNSTIEGKASSSSSSKKSTSTSTSTTSSFSSSTSFVRDRVQQKSENLTTTKSTESFEQKEQSSAEDGIALLGISPTTYRPVRPHTSAQERERKLMNVLAARRSALNRGGFRTRVGTTGRTATSSNASGFGAGVETTSKAPSDPRSICIRNCTKNFTRRTTASCMRQCAATATTTTAMPPNSTKVIIRPSSKMGVVNSSSRANSEKQRDTNEILFTDESSHGLFVVAKEQNDTLNHIPDVTKATKNTRTRGKPATVLPLPLVPISSIEVEDTQPYLYFGQKLPPIKPDALTITSVSDEHPKILEVSVARPRGTTPTVTPAVTTTVGTTSTLSDVERSRSRFKYHMRDRGTTAFNWRSSSSGLNGNKNNREIVRKSTLLNERSSTTTSPSTITIRKEEVKQPLLGELTILRPVEPSSKESFKEVKAPSLVSRSGALHYQSNTETSTDTSYVNPSTPLFIKVVSDEEHEDLLSSTSTTTLKPLTTATSTTTPRSTSSSTSKMLTTTTTATSTSTTITPTPKTTTTTTTTARPSPTPLVELKSADNETQFAPIHTNEHEHVNSDDQANIIIFLNQTASSASSTSRPANVQQHAPTTDASSAILHTTILTSVRSTVNPRIDSTTASNKKQPAAKPVTQAPNFIGIVESAHASTNIKPVIEINSTTVSAEAGDASYEMDRMNIATMVLAIIGIFPLMAVLLYLVRTYIIRRHTKDDEDFDVCIGDQQPISPVKKLDSLGHHINDDDVVTADEIDNHHQTIVEQHTNQTQLHPLHESLSNGLSNGKQRHYDEQVSVTSGDPEFDRSNIRLKSLLGEGNFGQVWKAEADDLNGHFGATRIVAVKTIRALSAQVSLKDEADIMRKLGSHPNVVTLLGACVESEPHMLIMEYAMRGRLLSLLRAARSATNILPASVPGGRTLAPLSPRTLAGFAMDIACGMEYIASRRIVHRDLAARNVLLDHNGVCKICDFGMSIDLDAERKRKDQQNNNFISKETQRNHVNKFKFDFGGRFILNHWHSQHTTHHNQKEKELEKKSTATHHHNHHHNGGHDTISKRHALPIRWMAPEALQYHLFTTETDVWAFGIVLWEIATLGSTPYSQYTGREVIRRVPNGLRPDLPKEGRHEFYNLMSRTWQKDPRMRPTFTQARQEISRSIHKWVDDDSAASDYMDVSGFSEDLEQGMVYFNHRISEFECEI